MASITGLLVCISPALPQNPISRQSGDQYYPLVKGNSWTFKVVDSVTGKTSRVTWSVDDVFDDKSLGRIFVINPTPMETDDQTMNLVVDAHGVYDRVADIFLIKFPLRKGEEWEYPAEDFHARVLDVHTTCTSGRFKFSDCLVIENREKLLGRNVGEGAYSRTVVSYAKGVGPVKYQYTRYPSQDPKADEKSISVLTLLSYKILSRASAQ